MVNKVEMRELRTQVTKLNEKFNHEVGKLNSRVASIEANVKWLTWIGSATLITIIGIALKVFLGG